MSIKRRILESAQSGLSRLTSLVIVDDDPLSHVESAALQAELTARKAAREKSSRKPEDSPLAKLGGFDAFAPTAQRIARDTLLAYPGLHVRTAAQAALGQFASFTTGDEIVPWTWHAVTRLRADNAAVTRARFSPTATGSSPEPMPQLRLA